MTHFLSVCLCGPEVVGQCSSRMSFIHWSDKSLSLKTDPSFSSMQKHFLRLCPGLGYLFNTSRKR